jgi:Uma2 family endonuclease
MELVITMKTTSSKLKSLNGKTKPNGEISYEDFLAWCDEDTWAEWVDGDIIMVSPASKQHQRILRFLMSLISSYVELNNLGEVLPAPFQMKLDKTRSGREPDLIYVNSVNLDRLKDNYLDGPADMVVEIVSEESINRDRGEKFIEYETAGISEYWLIDPIRQQAEFYRLGADNYYHLILPDEKGIYHSEVVRGFWLRVSWLWQEPPPLVWDAWQELSRQR